MLKTVRFLKRTLFFCLPLLLLGMFLSHSKQLDSASLTSATATLSNSRLSFYGAVAAGVSYNGTSVTIIGAGATYPDLNTNHLFPGDTLLVGVDGEAAVGGVSDATHFFTTNGLRAAASTNERVLATQSGTLSVGFTTTTDIPPGGDIIINLPDPPANGNDGAPNNEAYLTTNGFDLNAMTTANLTCPTTGTWVAESVSAGAGSGHTVICSIATGLTAPVALTVIVGAGSKPLVNPAPINVGHTQGIADIYTVNVKTRDAVNTALDESDILIAPIEAVLVSATIDETLAFQVAGLASGTTACDQTLDVTTTPYSVPWGTVANFDYFTEGAQVLAVQTNAASGYTVKVEENDQMGKNGTACTGVAPAADGFTFGSATCLRDTVCGAAACSESAARDWTTATYNGLGFSLEDVGTGSTDAVFDFNGKSAETTCTTGTFCSRQFADIAGSETKATILSNSGAMATHRANVCYRLSVSPIQPAGYYYNKVKYTCTASF